MCGLTPAIECRNWMLVVDRTFLKMAPSNWKTNDPSMTNNWRILLNLLQKYLQDWLGGTCIYNLNQRIWRHKGGTWRKAHFKRDFCWEPLAFYSLLLGKAKGLPALLWQAPGAVSGAVLCKHIFFETYKFFLGGWPSLSEKSKHVFCCLSKEKCQLQGQKKKTGKQVKC